MTSKPNNEDEYRLRFPIEVVIGQTPLSHQARAQAKEGWKRLIGASAKAEIESARDQYFLDERPLSMTIYYFPSSAKTPDIDNIVKPILDGLKSIAYKDDSCIERVLAQKFEPDVSWSFPSPSPRLQAAIGMETPVVYIRIEDDLTWRSAL